MNGSHIPINSQLVSSTFQTEKEVPTSNHAYPAMVSGINSTLETRKPVHINVSESNYQNKILIKKMLLRYQHLFGNMRVPCSFIIPESEDWPIEMWGEKLGKKVSSIRNSNQYIALRDELVEMGFSFDTLNNKKRWSDIEAAFMSYRMNYGDNVPISKSFIVPINDEKWPSNTWGIHLWKSSCGGGAHGGGNCNSKWVERWQYLHALGFKFEDGDGLVRVVKKKRKRQHAKKEISLINENKPR